MLDPRGASRCSSPACWSGRTPEYLGKKIGPREIKLASLVHPGHPHPRAARHRAELRDPGGRERTSRRRRSGTPACTASPRCSTPSPPRPTTTARRSPGLTANTPWFNTALGVAMLLGRFLPIVFVLALAGSLAAQDTVPVTAGTLPTAPAAVRRPAHRRDGHRHRTHLLPRTRAGSPGGRAAVMTMSTTTLTSHRAPPRGALPRRGVRLGAARGALPGAFAQARPRARCGATRSCSSSRSAPCSPRCSRSPSRSSAARSSPAAPPCRRVHRGHRRLALAHRDLRQPGRVRGRGPRQGPGRQPAPDPHQHHAHAVDGYDAETDPGAERAATSQRLLRRPPPRRHRGRDRRAS